MTWNGLGSGPSSLVAPATITGTNPATAPLTVIGAPAQAVSTVVSRAGAGAVSDVAFDVQNSAGTSQATLGFSGRVWGKSLVIAGVNTLGANKSSLIETGSATNVGLVLRGASAQSANLQEWRDSTDAALATVSSVGAGSFTTIRAYANAVSVAGAAASARQMKWQTSTSDRWVAAANATAESGANAGSNFEINRYDDTGTLIGTSVFISRATGTVSVSGGLSAGLNSTGFVIVNGAAATNRPVSFQTGFVNRWAVQANNTAEGGANAGSDLVVLAYDDAGAVLFGGASPLSIVRSTGVVTIPSLINNVSVTWADSVNVILGTGTGTKIGTATNQKLGFFNKAPVVQRAAIGAPTAPSAIYVQAEAQSMKTSVDALRQVLIDLGFTA